MGSSLPSSDKITTAVITGDHSFDVPGFHAIFRDIAHADCYIQHQDNFLADVASVRREYDVLLFYNMPRELPGDAGRKALEELGTTGQGIFLLHHAILSYPDWPFWSDLVGIADRSFGYHHGEQLHVDITDGSHPITDGLEAWDMVDETYTMDSPGDGVLLSIEHPRSMKAIAWTHQFKSSRVFCFQSGHDNETYVDPNFREVISRGIRWCAGCF